MIIVTAIMLTGASAAFGQSVDCTKAGSVVEKIICSDAELKVLDSRMAELYSKVLKTLPPAEQTKLQNEQKGWMGIRDECATAVEPRRNCVSYAYTQRNNRLEGLLTKVAASGTQTTKYLCEDKSTLTIQPVSAGKDQARVSHGASSWTLLRVPSASGAKYADNDVSVWNKGTEVLFEQGGKTLKCAAAK